MEGEETLDESLQISNPLVMLDTNALDSSDKLIRNNTNNESTESAVLARTAIFRVCHCDGYDGEHLSVETRETVVIESAGVAISYTWGEFDRQYHRIGHRYGKPLEEVRICLGAEWLVEKFTARLVQLSAEHGACWIDQFCLPQTEENGRHALATIPHIYRTLEVVVILPGPICGCLRKVYDEHLVAKSAPAQDAYSAGKRDGAADKSLFLAILGQCCLNSTGNCSWLRRLWTLQEFRYARTISVLYADQDVAPCYSLKEFTHVIDLERLARYLKLTCEKTQSQYGSQGVNVNSMFHSNVS